MLVRPDYVLVDVPDVPNADAVRHLCAAIDRALEAAELRAVLFDTRTTAKPTDEVNKAMWEWTADCRHHDVVAIVVKSELLRVSGNMTALSKGIGLKSFSTIPDAEAFLRRKTPKGPKRPLHGRL